MNGCLTKKSPRFLSTVSGGQSGAAVFGGNFHATYLGFRIGFVQIISLRLKSISRKTARIEDL